MSHSRFQLAIVLTLSLLVAYPTPRATPTYTLPPQSTQSSTTPVPPTATPVSATDSPATTRTPLPLSTPTPTLYMDMWNTFSSPAYAISLQYPADWQPMPGYGSPEIGEIRFAAINGFFQIGAMDADNIDFVAAAEAGYDPISSDRVAQIGAVSDLSA